MEWIGFLAVCIVGLWFTVQGSMILIGATVFKQTELITVSIVCLIIGGACLYGAYTHAPFSVTVRTQVK